MALRETNISNGFGFLSDAGGLYPPGWADLSFAQIDYVVDEYIIKEQSVPAELLMPMLTAKNDLVTFLYEYIDPEASIIDEKTDPVVLLKIDSDQEIESIYAPKIFAVQHDDQLVPCLRFGRKYITVAELSRKVVEQGGTVDVVFEQPPQGEGYPTLQWAFKLGDTFYIFEGMFRIDPKLGVNDFADIKMLVRGKEYDELTEYLMTFDPNAGSSGKYGKLKDLELGRYEIADIVAYQGKPEYDKFGFSVVLKRPDGSTVQVNPNAALGNDLRPGWLTNSASMYVGRVVEILEKQESTNGIIVKTRLLSVAASKRALNGGKPVVKQIECAVPVPEAKPIKKAKTVVKDESVTVPTTEDIPF